MKLRSRIIKPEFFQKKRLATLLPQDRLLFIGLWILADREGLLPDEPPLIQGYLFPYEIGFEMAEEYINVERGLASLTQKRFIVRYEVDGDGYIWVPNFKKHQSINKHEAESTIPLPDNVIQDYGKETNMHNNDYADSPNGRSRSRRRSSSRSNSKDQEIPFEEIISHLNILAQKKRGFNWATDYNQKQIKRRWREGYRLDDFLRVNQVKSEEWLATDMEKHLNPETLYGNKMEKYLNQRRIPRQYSEKTNKALVAAALFLKNKGVTLETKGLTEIDGSNVEVTKCI